MLSNNNIIITTINNFYFYCNGVEIQQCKGQNVDHVRGRTSLVFKYTKKPKNRIVSYEC